MIIRKACSRELTDLGLIFNSLNIKVVQSEVADARRRMSAAEAQATADIVQAQQARRAKEATIEAERIISDRQRELEQTTRVERRAHRAGGSEASGSDGSPAHRRARRDADRPGTCGRRAVTITAQAAAEAEAIRIRVVAERTAESIEKVNKAIAAGGESYFRYRQIEMLPQIAPDIAAALAEAKLITISGGEDGGAANSDDEPDRERHPDGARRAAGDEGRHSGATWRPANGVAARAPRRFRPVVPPSSTTRK